MSAANALWFPYARRVRRAWRKALSLPRVREGLLLRVRGEDGAVGWGEAAPLAGVHGLFEGRESWLMGHLGPLVHTLPTADWLGADSLDELGARLDAFATSRDDRALPSCVRFALEMAWVTRRAQSEGHLPAQVLAASPRQRVPVNSLVQATPRAITAYLDEHGTTAWPAIKVKVGRRSALVEREAVDQLLAALPHEVVVRLDANRAWTLDEATERLEGLPWDRLHSIEEPLADPTALPQLVARCGAGIALDETLREPSHEGLWYGTGVKAWVLKPGALGVSRSLALDKAAAKARIEIVVSSCLESPLGLRFLAQLAAALTQHVGAAGLGTEALFRGEAIAAPLALEHGHVSTSAWQGTPRLGPLARSALSRAVRPGAQRHHAPPLKPLGAHRTTSVWTSTQDPRLASVLANVAVDAHSVCLPFDPRRAASNDALGLQLVGASLAALRETGATRGDVAIGDRRVGTLLRTSGTMGQPRLVAHSWAQHARAALEAIDLLRIDASDRLLLSLGAHHVGGFGLAMRAALSGATLVFAEPDEALEAAILRCEPTLLSLVPTQIHRLLRSTAATDRLRQCKAILLGGAPASAALRAACVDAGLPVWVTYGATETTAFVTASNDPGVVRQAQAAGRPHGSSEVRIDAQGAVHVRGPRLCLGHWNGEDVVDLRDAAGWYATGDLGHLDEDGVLHIEGRADRAFQRGGETVHPERIEAALLTLPGVVNAAVVPAASESWGTVPIAFLAGDPPPRLAEAEAFARAHLPAYERPERFLAWPRDISPDGKPPIADLTRRVADASRAPGNGPLPSVTRPAPSLSRARRGACHAPWPARRAGGWTTCSARPRRRGPS